MPSEAQEPSAAWEAQYNARLVAEFEGGVRANDAVDLWLGFGPLWGSNRFPTEAYPATAADTGLCSMVERHMHLPKGGCTARLEQSLTAFSKEHGGAGEFAATAVFRLPRIEVETYPTLRHFDMSVVRQRAEAEALLADPGFLAFKGAEFVLSSGDYKPVTRPFVETRQLPERGTYAVETRGVRWYLPLSGEFTADDLNQFETIVAALGTATRTVGLQRATRLQRVPNKKFGATPQSLYETCLNPNGADGKPKPVTPVGYAALMASDLGTEELADAQNCAPPKPTAMIIVDRTISRHPDLVRALGAPSSPAPTTPTCSASVPTLLDEHHGTYVAGLVAASGAHAGFRGINPDVRIRHVADFNPTTRRQIELSELRNRLRQALIDGRQARVVPWIVLYASAFGSEEPAGSKLMDQIKARRFKRHDDRWVEELRDVGTRLEFPAGAAEVINNAAYRYLFVVSAGQDPKDDLSSPLALRQVSNMSPQNLGDFSNVLTITACRNCAGPHGTAEIWKNAYYSAKGEQVVLLAAPGGDPVPGLATADKIGSAGGTSAAAAIVAGVASRMVGCYPDSYGDHAGISRLKERLLITARQNLRAEDIDKAPAGVVDPQLAMIDPEETWLKAPGRKLEAVKIFRWCNVAFEMNRNLQSSRADPSYPLVNRVRRITRTPTGQHVFREMDRLSWTEASPPLTVSPPLRPLPWQVKKPFAVLERPDGSKCHLELGDVEDFVVGHKELNRSLDRDFYGTTQECATAPQRIHQPCFQ